MITLKILHVNINGIKHKKDTLYQIINDYDPDIISIQETKLTEHDEKFKKYLRKTRSMAIDMETATIFVAGFYNKIPTGAFLLVTDQPMVPEGVKTDASDLKVSKEFVDTHIRLGIGAMKEIASDGRSVKHLKF